MMSESTEDQIKRLVGPEGFENLKAHAAMLNISFSSFVFMANFQPVALLEMLHEAALKRKLETESSEAPKPRVSGGPVEPGTAYLVGGDNPPPLIVYPPGFLFSFKADDLDEVDRRYYVTAQFVTLHNPKTDQSEQVNASAKDVIRQMLSAGWVLVNGNPDEYNTSE
jgi:hypothetical protein